MLRNFGRRALLITATTAFGCWLAPAIGGDASLEPSCCNAARQADSVWLVDTRCAGCGDPRTRTGAIRFSRRMPDGSWAASDLASFLASDDPNVPTVVWVHGNRYSASDATHEGWQTYQALGRYATHIPSMRFVIFSWPSGRTQGSALEDARIKAARTPANAYYLAWLVNQIDPRVPISYTGFSYGARIITGGLHLLGGGMLNGWVLDSRVQQSRAMRAVLVAAAIDNCWLWPGNKHGNAVFQLEKLTNIYNSCDRALKRYHWLYHRKSGATAIGHNGMAGVSRLGESASKVTQLDACCYVGKQHTWMNYVAACRLFARIAADLLPVTQLEVAKR